MSQYLLDSNVLSELWKKDPAASVLDWLDSSEWLIPVVVIAEIQEGAEAAPSLARREEISRKLAEFISEFSSLVVDWDSETALVWAKLRHSPEVKRQPIPMGQLDRRHGRPAWNPSCHAERRGLPSRRHLQPLDNLTACVGGNPRGARQPSANHQRATSKPQRKKPR
jgi:predicted nucleic acid-binding protein